MTLPVTLELPDEEYEVRVVHVYQENAGETLAESVFRLTRFLITSPARLSRTVFSKRIFLSWRREMKM